MASNEAHQEEAVYLEVLDRGQVRLELELWQNNNLVTAVRAYMADHHKGVDMALREQAQHNLCESRSKRVSP